MAPGDQIDLYTSIHKALRLALFEITIEAGRIDWADPLEVTNFARRWPPVLALLRAHTAHGDNHVLRLLDRHDAAITEAPADQHRDLNDLLDDLDERLQAVLSAPDTAAGLAFYRDLARFVAACLPHLHFEETEVMPRIRELCGAEEIAAARAAIVAESSPELSAITLEFLLPALDRCSRRMLASQLFETASPPVVATTANGAATEHQPLTGGHYDNA